MLYMSHVTYMLAEHLLEVNQKANEISFVPLIRLESFKVVVDSLDTSHIILVL